MPITLDQIDFENFALFHYTQISTCRRLAKKLRSAGGIDRQSNIKKMFIMSFEKKSVISQDINH